MVLVVICLLELIYTSAYVSTSFCRSLRNAVKFKKVDKIMENIEVEEHIRQWLFPEVFLLQIYAWPTIFNKKYCPGPM
jgi:hypothetical protein